MPRCVMCTWKALSGHEARKEPSAPCLPAFLAAYDSVGAGSHTSMKSAIRAMICADHVSVRRSLRAHSPAAHRQGGGATALHVLRTAADAR